MGMFNPYMGGSGMMNPTAGSASVASTGFTSSNQIVSAKSTETTSTSATTSSSSPSSKISSSSSSTSTSSTVPSSTNTTPSSSSVSNTMKGFTGMGATPSLSMPMWMNMNMFQMGMTPTMPFMPGTKPLSSMSKMTPEMIRKMASGEFNAKIPGMSAMKFPMTGAQFPMGGTMAPSNVSTPSKKEPS